MAHAGLCGRRPIRSTNIYNSRKKQSPDGRIANSFSISPNVDKGPDDDGEDIVT
jgi:hypothetical protein